MRSWMLRFRLGCCRGRYLSTVVLLFTAEEDLKIALHLETLGTEIGVYKG